MSEEETTLLTSGIPASPVHRSSDDGDSTGYSTDYSTLEVVRRPNKAASSSIRQPRPTLPVRGNGHGVCRVGEELASDGEREEVLEAAIAGVGLARNMRLLPRPEDGDEGKDEEDTVRDDSDGIPPSISCSLIPWCAVRYCEYLFWSSFVYGRVYVMYWICLPDA